MMKVTIKKVRRCKNSAFGNFMLRGGKSALITISLERNKMLYDYWMTLLHELLHLFFTLLRRERFKVTNKQEHQIIYDIEDALAKSCGKHCKGNLTEKDK